MEKKTGFSIACILSGAVVMASGVVLIADAIINLARPNDKK